MNATRRHSLLAAIAAGALLATAFTASADPVPQRDNDRQEQRKDKREQRQERREDRREAKQERREDRREVKQERRQDRREVQRDHRDDRGDARARYAYRQRVQAERARQAAQRRAYERQRHASQFSYAPAYRYSYGGRWYDTSRYGANVLRQAVQRGYQEGLRAGRSDRYDRWGYDHRRSRIWIEGNRGFGGRYVSRSDYAHYFRQGFQRGYEDGFYSRGRYGQRVNGEAIIIQAVLEAILGFQRLG